MLEEDGWMRDALFFFIACAVHGALLCANPALPWTGPQAKAPEPALEVDFVAALPQPSTPELASVVEKPKALPAARRPTRGVRTHRRDRMSGRPLPRLAAERARLTAQRAQELARERTAAARRRIEIRRQLAALPGPEEELSDAPNDPDLGAAPRAEHAPADPLYEESERRRGAEPSSEFSSEGLSWSIEGPAGNRRLLAKALPASPEWLARRGLELCVAIRFQVLADGAVRPGAVIQKTSGFPEIDRRALDALRRWRFEPAGGTGAAGIWGKVTFRFLMG